MTISRRHFLQTTAAAGAILCAPAISTASSRPIVTHGVQSGDVDTHSGVIWARSDRPARAYVDISTTGSFNKKAQLEPTTVLPNHDFTMKRLLTGLPPGQHIFYRITFEDLTGKFSRSNPIVGHFSTAPVSRRDVRFAWSGDTAGQGWGIDTGRGGMATYTTISAHQPDFFLHSGDVIYADAPIAAAQKMPNGEIWNNLVAEGVGKVAESLDEFRGRFRYNLLDQNISAMNARMPTFFQWDDHEVIDNWSDATDLSNDDRYAVKDIRLLAARARQAFHDMTPVRHNPNEPGRIYRKINYGPMLEIFFVDLRSYRGPNGPSMETELTDASRIIGSAQLAWLKQALADSKATWKVIASDMPIGLIVWDDWRTKSGAEAIANGDKGLPKGRELEIADLLRFMKTERIDNVVWLTADVHYTAAHVYDPNRAQFQEFNPFWEFVSGPLHAGTFGPNDLDTTFGPEVRFAKAPETGQFNLPPSEGLQFFGLVDIESQSEEMTVRLMDRNNKELYKTILEPVRR